MSDDLRTLIESGVKLVNKRLDIPSLYKRYGINDDRTAVLTITSPKGNIGFSIQNGKLVMGPVPKPTVEIVVSEKTIWAIVTRKLTFTEAFFDGQIELIGPHSLRDFIIFQKVISEFGHVFYGD